MNRRLGALGLALSLAVFPFLAGAGFAADPPNVAVSASTGRIIVGKLKNAGTDDKPAWNLVVKEGDKEVSYVLDLASATQVDVAVKAALAGANAAVVDANAQIGGAGVPGVNIDASGNLQVTGADGANVTVSGGNVSVTGGGANGANVKVDGNGVAVSGAGANVNVALKGLLDANKGKDTNVVVSGAFEEKDGKKILKVNSLVPESK